MNNLNEKVSILKAVYEVLEDVKLNEDLDSFTYEDLLEKLVAQKPDLDATHLILQHGAFIVEQVNNTFSHRDCSTVNDRLPKSKMFGIQKVL